MPSLTSAIRHSLSAILLAIIIQPAALQAAPGRYVYADSTNFYTVAPGVTNDLGPFAPLTNARLAGAGDVYTASNNYMTGANTFAGGLVVSNAMIQFTGPAPTAEGFYGLRTSTTSGSDDKTIGICSMDNFEDGRGAYSWWLGSNVDPAVSTFPGGSAITVLGGVASRFGIFDTVNWVLRTTNNSVIIGSAPYVADDGISAMHFWRNGVDLDVSSSSDNTFSGTNAFTKPVAGVDPVETNDFVTLGYYERTSPEPVTYFLDVGITATVAYAESGAYRTSVTPAVTNAERTISGITNNQYLLAFAFQEPADMMSAGLYKCEIKALDSGAGSGQDLKFTWEGYHWTNGVVQGDFETGANSAILTDAEDTYIIPFVNTQSVARAANGAFGIKLRAVVTGVGAAPSITIYTGPDHLSCVRTIDAEGVFATRSEFTSHASRHAGAGADPITSIGAITHTGLDSFAGQSATNINVIEGTTLVVRTAATLPATTMNGNLNLGANSLVGNSGSSGIRVDANGMVGIGTNAPQYKIHAVSPTNTTTGPTFMLGLEAYDGEVAGLISLKALGTQASPSAPGANANIMNFAARGYGATGFGTANQGSFQFRTAEAFTDTSKGTFFQISTTPTNTTTVTPSFKVQANGCINFVPKATFPTDQAIGDIMYHSTSNNLYVWDNTAWTAPSDKPPLIGMNAWAGVNGTLGPGWYNFCADHVVVFSDTNAGITANFHVARGGSFKVVMVQTSEANGTGKTMSGVVYVDSAVTTGSVATHNLLNAANWDIALANINVVIISKHATAFTVPDNSFVAVTYLKDDNAGGAAGNVMWLNFLLERQ